jgi:hypothetical protein
MKKETIEMTKVTFYMKSGNSFSLEFEEFEMSKLSGSKKGREMKYKTPSKGFTIDLDEVEAVVVG